MGWRFVKREWGGWFVVGPAGHAGELVRVPALVPGGAREVKLGPEVWAREGVDGEAGYRIVWSRPAR